MKLKLALTLGVAVIVTAAAAACGGSPPPPPAPEVDSAAIRDSIARARADSLARARARADSIRRAREREEAMRRAREDSLARATTRAVREILEQRVHFDFDRSNIRPGVDTEMLVRKVAVLQANPNLRVMITGHCDERGSDEYNMALGNRRALSAKQFLVNRGIAANRIETRSMGERQPVDPRSNEEAWSRNRRDEFTIVAGGDRLTMPRM